MIICSSQFPNVVNEVPLGTTRNRLDLALSHINSHHELQPRVANRDGKVF